MILKRIFWGHHSLCVHELTAFLFFLLASTQNVIDSAIKNWTCSRITIHAALITMECWVVFRFSFKDTKVYLSMRTKTLSSAGQFRGTTSKELFFYLL